MLRAHLPAKIPVAVEFPEAMQDAVAYVLAGEYESGHDGTGLTILAWLMRVGFLVSPPIVGAIADSSSLRVGLLIVPFAGLLVIGFSQVLRSRIRS